MNNDQVLKYLSESCMLADMVYKDRSDIHTVLKSDHPAFFSNTAAYFDYPKPEFLNELIKDGLIFAETSPWSNRVRVHPYLVLRHFYLTDKGDEYIKDKIEKGRPLLVALYPAS